MNAIPILDYGDLLAHTLLFLALVAAGVVGVRKASHALTRENAAHLLRQRAQRRRKSDLYTCELCHGPCDFSREMWVAVCWADGSAHDVQNAPLCANCADAVTSPPRATRARGSSST